MLRPARWALALSCLPFALLSNLSVQAQEAGAVEEIVVTGSFIKRKNQADLASPLTTVDSSDISNIGAQSIADITQTLTINTGAQNNPDAFTQGGTTGTANINLRGLGLQSTLVLVNGKRNVLSASTTNDGISFVDTNSLVPLIAIERLEVLKDGAAALYGSDAVAGVANYITVSDFDGVRLSSNFQFHAADVGSQDQSDFRIEGLVGKTFDRGSVLLAASWFDRNALTTAERRLSLAANDSSALGNPGTFFDVGAGVTGTPAGLGAIDPACADAGGTPLVIAPGGGTAPDGGFCQFDFGDFFNLVPNERRFNQFSEAKFDLTDTIEAKVDFAYADINTERGNSPTFPFLQTALVSADNPENPFGAPVAFVGRAIGNGGEVSPSIRNANTYRLSASIGSSEFLKNGAWEISYTRGQSQVDQSVEDTVTARFQCALQGIQGTDAINASAGVANCGSFTGFDGPIPTGFFNPFGTSFSTAPNDPAILDFIIDELVTDSQSNLDVVDAFFTTELVDAPTGTISLAVGAQYRNERLDVDADDIANEDGFGFLIGSNDFGGVTDVYAFFGELSIPIYEFAELQVAGRFEGFGADGGSTADPKVALLITPNDWVSLRGSYSTSFRAPTTFQQDGESTSLNQVVDPTGGTAFAAVRAFGTADLAPEESRAFNGGISLLPVEGLQIDFDYFNFRFTDAITQESFQALVDANPVDTRTFDGAIPTQACLAEFTVVCRSGDPVNGTILQVNTQFVNAESIDTSGFDFRAAYQWDAGVAGTFEPSFEGTYILEYDIDDPTLGEIDGAGNRNFGNIGSPTPRLRTNVGLNWFKGAHQVNFFARRIGGYDDDQNGGIRIPDQTRYDIRYTVDLGEALKNNYNAIASFSVLNLTDEEPPFVATNGGFDSRVADPRGRLVQFALGVQF